MPNLAKLLLKLHPEMASTGAPQPVPVVVERTLTHAFTRFTEAAQSLERSYHQLELEVIRLRQQLEERNAELARSLEENRRIKDSLYQVLEGMPCGVMVAERGGRLSVVNPVAARVLGATQQTPTELSQLPAGVVALLEAARGRQGEWELEIPSLTDEPRSVTVRHASLADHASVFIVQDVTERKRCAQQRERLERQRALAEMAAVLAHEIRNPLGSLEVFAGLLAECDLEAEPRSWVEHLQAGLRTLAATANNVLHFHNLPALERAPIDLQQLLGWVRDFFLPVAKQSGVELRVGDCLPAIEVYADRHRLEQVLLNLAINSVRFVPAGGWILFSAKVDESMSPAEAEIEVADSGPGIANLERIFDAGYTTRPGSPGLGLTVCKTIVEQHGGTIRAANGPAGGAIFTVRLPMGDPQ